MTPPPLTPELRAYITRLLVLVALLVFVAGFAVGYQVMTLKELAGQAVQGLVAVVVTAGVVRK